MDTSIFKAYDIRGIYPEQLDEKGARMIGQAVAAYTGAKKIAVGMDMRSSSENLKNALIEGLNAQGTDALEVGLVSTPMLYFASWKLDVDAAIMITASHNTAEWNGFKLCKKGAVPIGEGDGMEEIRDLALAGSFSTATEKGRTDIYPSIRSEYYAYVKQFFKTGLGKKKVVFDFANSVGALDRELYDALSEDIEPVYLFPDLDGTFPNHEANPLKTETLRELQEKVLATGADLGVAYDGDADRVGFVDEKGEIVPMDFMIALLGKEALKKNPGATILMDLRSSNAVKEALEEAGATVHRCRVGHSLIKRQMRAEEAVFAGELSGHYFFQENAKAEMTTLAVITVLNMLSETGKSLSELVAELKKYSHSGEINSEVADKEAVLAKLKEKYADGKLDELDGIRIDFADWWFNVRASNTEPKLRLNLEAKTAQLMEEKRAELLALIRS